MTNGATASLANIRIATPQDVVAITRCVCAAYLRHIERVGKQPWPMLQDYSNVIGTSQVRVAGREGRIVGVLELFSLRALLNKRRASLSTIRKTGRYEAQCATAVGSRSATHAAPISF